MQDSALKQCIEECLECHAACLEAFANGLGLDGPHKETDHLRLLLDCAEICQTAANFMLRQSPSHAAICGVCAQICRECAEDCARFPQDKQMQTCAESCRRCAASCADMASAAAAAA